MNVQPLVQALAALQAKDALPCKLSADEWRAMAPYLSVRFLRPGEPLVREGDCDRELFILAEGELEVCTRGHVIATLQAGSVVGEGTFLSGEPRSATVVPASEGVAWGLGWDRFNAMCNKQPLLALDLLKGLAVVLAVRMRQALLVGNFT